jgi:pimeloyl-ACP methyl ester carboxylesterase
MPHARLEDVSLYYEEIGEGEPLLLISGQSSDRHAWDDVRDDYAARYRVIVYDHRGLGDSDKPLTPPYTTRGFARDAIGLLDYLGIARAHAYGMSMGGRICQWLGIDHPTRVGALVLGCTTPGNAHGIPRPPEVDALMSSLATHPERQMEFNLAYMVSSDWAARNPDWVAAQEQRVLNPVPEAYRRLHRDASEGHDTWDQLPTITAPVLVIHGGADLVNPTANAPLLAGRIPGAELRLIDGARHGYQYEYRAEASAAVLDFLARHPLG